MKKTVLLMLLAVIVTVNVSAQCKKRIMLTSATTQYVDDGGAVADSRPENVSIVITDTGLVVTISGEGQEAHDLIGKISSYTCDWKVPYKEGKTVIKSLLADPRGEERNATMTIEGKNGKISFLAEIEGEQRKIALVVDKFEEKK